jgi:hypothetical protein
MLRRREYISDLILTKPRILRGVSKNEAADWNMSLHC